jgi:recombinational DNA repair protein RecR
MKKTIQVKVLDHIEETPTSIVVQTKVYKTIDKEINVCDKCGRGYSDDNCPTCIGCGKTLCYICNRDEDLEQIQLWVGIQEEYGDNYYIEGSDDFDVEDFYLCKSCKENPPEKIKFWNKQKKIENLEDQIKKITQEMIMEARKVK